MILRRDEDRLARAGRLLFGRGWRAPLSRLLGVDRRRLSRLLEGDEALTPPLASILRLEVMKARAQLRRLEDEL